MNLEEEFATLESGLASLPIIERETLTLFYLRELSLEEIAGLVDVPVGTVKSRLFRARQMLRRVTGRRRTHEYAERIDGDGAASSRAASCR